MGLAEAIAAARAEQPRHVEELSEFLSIPSISTLPEHVGDLRRAAFWLIERVRALGLRKVELIETGGHPVVYAEWMEAGPAAPTVLVYGHYDVQPAELADGWKTPPFSPTVKDGRIYARGATDDKGPTYAQIKALQALITSGSAPVNLRLFFEGEEEVGSRNLDPLVLAQRQKLACDCILVTDTGFLTPEVPQMLYGLRGIAALEIEVRGPKQDIHSGGYGGTVNNPAHALARLIASLHDDQARVAVPGFYDKVRVLPPDERESLARASFGLEHWQSYTGLTKPWGEPGFSLLERIGARPTVEVNGIWGGFQGEGTKTIIPATAHAKITSRLVPYQDPHETAALLKAYIESQAPDDVQVIVTIPEEPTAPVLTPRDGPAVEAALAAYRAIWGAEAVSTLGGGSLPVMATMQKALDAPVILLGFALPDAGVHGPNEFFVIDQLQKGIEAILTFYFEYAARRR